jgi:hypothetical protein
MIIELTKYPLQKWGKKLKQATIHAIKSIAVMWGRQHQRRGRAGAGDPPSRG